MYHFLGADVAHGDACVEGTDTCIGTGTYACISSVCECATTFFRNTDDDACLASKFWGKIKLMSK